MITQHDKDDILNAVEARLDSVTTSAGTHGIMYDTDEDGLDYASVGYNLPDGLYAEVEHGTYGELQAIRVYL